MDHPTGPEFFGRLLGVKPNVLALHDRLAQRTHSDARTLQCLWGGEGNVHRTALSPGRCDG
eukprot:11997613-Alexandrium_andersonii.AAC.1